MNAGGAQPKFCGFCGKPVSADGRPAKFCINCGKTLSPPSSPVLPPAAQSGGLRRAPPGSSSGNGPPKPPTNSTPSGSSSKSFLSALSLSRRSPSPPSSGQSPEHELPKFNPTGLLRSTADGSTSSASASSSPTFTSKLRKAPPPASPRNNPTFSRPDPSPTGSFSQRRATMAPSANMSSMRVNPTSGHKQNAGEGLEFLALAKAKAEAHERAREQRREEQSKLQGEPTELRRRNTIVAHTHENTARPLPSRPSVPSTPTSQPPQLQNTPSTAPSSTPTGPSSRLTRLLPPRPNPALPATPVSSRPANTEHSPSASSTITSPPALARSASSPSHPNPSPVVPTKPLHSSSPNSVSTPLLPTHSVSIPSLPPSSTTATPSAPPNGPPPVTPRGAAKKLPPPPPSPATKGQLSNLTPTPTTPTSAAPAPPSGGPVPPPVPSSAHRPELPSPSRPPSTEDAPDPATRERIIKEIVDTEDDYIRDLEVMINVYLVAIREHNLGTKDQINNIFSNIEMIYKINKGIFLPVLKTDSVGKAFLTVVDYLKLYMVYCGNQDLSMQTLAALKANSKAEQILHQCSRKPECRSLDLASFLIKPIQRICKYPLLIRELLKNTPEDHPDHTNLTTALQRMTSTVGTINEKKSDSDKKMRLYELQHKITLKGDMHLLDSPNRRLIREGEIIRISPKEVLGKKLVLKTQGHYFLFSDLFLFTKPTSSSYDLKAQIPLNQALYKDSDIAEDSFELTQIGQKRVFFAAPSSAKKADLKKELEEVIASFLDVRYKKFVQKEIAKTLAMHVQPINLEAPAPVEPTLPPDFSVMSFDDWKNKLEAKPLPSSTAQENCVRFVCNSPAPESEKRVIKLMEGNVTLAALQDQIRKKFELGPAVGFRIVYPNNDGSWEMCPVNEQKDLDTCLEKKISDLFLSWLT